eukprot:1159015-Pelagomonas_calceolata.AAC.1
MWKGTPGKRRHAAGLPADQGIRKKGKTMSARMAACMNAGEIKQESKDSGIWRQNRCTFRHMLCATSIKTAPAPFLIARCIAGSVQNNMCGLQRVPRISQSPSAANRPPYFPLILRWLAEKEGPDCGTVRWLCVKGSPMRHCKSSWTLLAPHGVGCDGSTLTA